MGNLLTPQDLGEGLHLRPASPADAGALRDFNARIHYESLGTSVEKMVAELHPIVRPEDFILVEDRNANDKVVASSGVVGHTWRYGDVPFEAGYIECVGTDPAYRQRGLMRKIIEVAHEISAAKGHLVQLVGGLRWFYRRFGYEYALAGTGHRELALAFVPALNDGETEAFHIRPAEAADLPVLMPLYERECAGKLLIRTRPEALWRYHIAGQDPGSLGEAYYTILDSTGAIAGYYGTWGDFPWGRRHIREIGVREGIALDTLLPSIQRFIQRFIAENAAAFGETTPETMLFDLGYNKSQSHPALEILDSYLTPFRGWVWYVRVADIPAFLLHIAPVLNQRLAASDLSGYAGDLKISFYENGLRLVFERGKLVQAEAWTSPEIDEGHDAAFPDHTFLQLLCGYRSLAELRYAFPDCWATPPATHLLNLLFPKQPSWGLY